MRKIILVIFSILIILLGVLYKKYNTSQRLLNNEIINRKAYQNELELSNKESLQFQLGMSTLKSMNDSISLQLKESIKQSKIKDSKIKSLSQQNIIVQIKDSIIYKDTIFNIDLKTDTVVGDKYFSMRLYLEYPNIIKYNPSFNVEISTIIYTDREYIKPRNRLWIKRIFQKKHTIIKGKTIINNPYVSQQTHRFIKIIK